MNRPLRPRVMKFGGTSVADATGLRRVAALIQASAAEPLVVVASAMSGVTDTLFQAADDAVAGRRRRARRLLAGLGRRHGRAARALLSSSTQATYRCQARAILDEAMRLLQGDLCAPDRDFLSGIGERLVVPLLAAVLNAQGCRSQALAATELILTQAANPAGGEPDMAATRICTQARLAPLLAQGVIPVVTGFIAATRTGQTTTLGRGSSDFSATILAAALEASEVVIWTDVDGLYPADPHRVAGGQPFAEISYLAAAHLAAQGAKVLHPKTIAPVMELGIPIWIRNSFAPHRRGTKITLHGPSLAAARHLTLAPTCAAGA